MKRTAFWGIVMPAVLRRLVPSWFLEPPVAVAARHPWLTLAFAGLLIAAGALIVAASGVIPIKASSGHWPITEWFLQFSMRRSIATHSLWIDVPPLDDPAMVLRGAAHYDLSCSACHGNLAGERPAIPRRMLPPPTDLATHVTGWRDAELFSIVKHGIKMTGMPAWPSQNRDDEVWAMVAFLRRLPELTPQEYVGLARGAGDPLVLEGLEGAPDVVADSCSRCHGFDGRGRGGAAFPTLAGQRAGYLDRALRAYADGRRHSGVMGPIAAGLDTQSRDLAVAYYASLPAPPPAPAPARMSGAVSRGAEIAARGVPDGMIPACSECHGPAAEPKNPAYPSLAGQHAEYLTLQLRLLRDGRRGGSEFVHLMRAFAGRLTDEQIESAAAYYASAPAAPLARRTP